MSIETLPRPTDTESPREGDDIMGRAAVAAEALVSTLNVRKDETITDLTRKYEALWQEYLRKKDLFDRTQRKPGLDTKYDNDKAALNELLKQCNTLLRDISNRKEAA